MTRRCDGKEEDKVKAKIADIFSSIQGEGKYLGSPMIFVRFAGCDVGCAWCDTDHAVREELSAEDLISRIRVLYQPGFFISLTGGEPLLQVEALEEVLPLLKKEGMPVFLETNGIRYQEFARVSPWIDIVAMDFKLPSSTGCRAFWAEHREMIDLVRAKEVFVKIVVTAKTSLDDIDGAVDIIASVDPGITVYLQPETSQIKNGSLAACVTMQKRCLEKLKDVRIVPQVHRLLGIQ